MHLRYKATLWIDTEINKINYKTDDEIKSAIIAELIDGCSINELFTKSLLKDCQPDYSTEEVLEIHVTDKEGYTLYDSTRELIDLID
jgi:hypothetical protein